MLPFGEGTWCSVTVPNPCCPPWTEPQERRLVCSRLIPPPACHLPGTGWALRMVPGQVKGKSDQAPHLVQTQMRSSMALKDQTVQGSDFQEVLSPPRPRPNHVTRRLPSRQFLEPDSDSAGLPHHTPGSAQCRGSDAMPAGNSHQLCSAQRGGRNPALLPVSLCLSGHLAPAPPPSVLVPRCHPSSSSLAK